MFWRDRCAHEWEVQEIRAWWRDAQIWVSGGLAFSTTFICKICGKKRTFP